MGVSGVAPEHIVTSGTATASYLQAQYPPATRMYVIGGDGLKQLLIRAGFELVETKAELVVCGIDFDLTYNKLRTATLLIRSGARFIGTNPDSSFPSPEGLVPGAGSILALIEAASGCAPTIIGKPERGMFEVALRRPGDRPGRDTNDRRPHRHRYRRRKGARDQDSARDGVWKTRRVCTRVPCSRI